MAGRRTQETGFYGNTIRQVNAPARGNVQNDDFKRSGVSDCGYIGVYGSCQPP